MHFQYLINTIEECRENLKVSQEDFVKLSGVNVFVSKNYFFISQKAIPCTWAATTSHHPQEFQACQCDTLSFQAVAEL